MYKHPTYFMNGCDTYTAVFNNKIAIIAKGRNNFGSVIDMASFDKVNQAINEGWIKSHKNFYKLILLVSFLVGVAFMIRGRDDHCKLTWSNIQFLLVTSSKFSECRKVEIVSLLNKTAQVSVANLKLRDNTYAMVTVKCLRNYSICVVY